MRTFVVIFAVVMNLALGDAVVKEIAAARFRPAAVTVIDGFFNLAYVENRGCAWGMLQGQAWPLAVFGAVALAALVWKRKSLFAVPCDGSRAVRVAARAAECLLYAGIFGNLIDRVCRGYVIDMFDVHWGVHHFPCFNLADAYISVAVVIMLALSLCAGAGKEVKK